MWWLFYSLLAAVFWGVGQIFVKKGLQSTSSLFNNIFSSFLTTVIFVPYALSHGVNFEKIVDILPVTIIIAVLFLAYYYAIGRGQLSLTGTLVGTYPLVTVLLSILFLHENPSVFQQIAILIIVIGTICIALPKKLNEFSKIKGTSWLWWGLVAIFSIGTSDFLIKLQINQSDLYTYLFTYGMITLPVALFTIFIDKKGRQLPPFAFKTYFPTVSGITMMSIGFFVFHLAVDEGLISLVSPISGIYVAITAFLAWLVLKETITRPQFIGIVLSAVGVVLIGIS